MMARTGRTTAGLWVTAAVLIAGALPAEGARSAREVYLDACASCHGADGRGAAQSQVGFDTPLPDFTDCSFATREPDADWAAVAHEGGPVRGFSHHMPALGGALTTEEIELAVAHVRTFCPERAWPRGDLNLPRALVTEKAFVEDEAVFETAIATEGLDTIANAIVYEQRFGARNQFELMVPFTWREAATPGVGGGEPGDPRTDWASSIGDIALGVKRALWHDLGRGSILSATAEVILPTGDEDRGFGKGTTVFEPFLSYGQLLPADFFLHSQGGLELPLDTDRAENEAFLRLVLGRSFTTGRFGRTWSPMIELLSARELASGADTNLDVVPQMQITLNTRQHIMLNIGVRTPLNNTEGRRTQVLAYILWDWFDGTLFEGW